MPEPYYFVIQFAMRIYLLGILFMLVKTCCYPNIYIPAAKKVDVSQGKEAVKIFNTVAAMHGLAADALIHLQSGNLSFLDSLATDCACHLRAIRIACLYQEILGSTSINIDSIIAELKQQQFRLAAAGEDCAVWCQKGKRMSGDLTPIVAAIKSLQEKLHTSNYTFQVHQLLEEFHASLVLPQKLAYAVHAYALAIVKEYHPLKDQVLCANEDCGMQLTVDKRIFKETTVLKMLTVYMQQIIADAYKPKALSEINIRMIQNELYCLAKQQLTDLSADFILDETEHLSDPSAYSYLQQTKKIVNGKIELPDYYSLTSAFQVALEKKIPVLLKIKKCAHAHRYQEPGTPFDAAMFLVPKKGRFKPIAPPEAGSKGPIIVVEAKRSGSAIQAESTQDYVQRLMHNFDFMHFCRLDGAQHKQYTSDDDALDQMPSEVIELLQQPQQTEEAQKLDGFKKIAIESGCAFSNQSTLILSHIFADTMASQQECTELLHQTAQWINVETKKISEASAC